MRLKRIAVGMIVLAGAALAATVGVRVSSASNPNSAIPHYQHIVEIMMENTSYSTIIGNVPRHESGRVSGSFDLVV
jgi:hypothetical protein